MTEETVRIYPDENVPSNIEVSAATIRGTRQYQEDSIRYLGTGNGVLGVVCDGMGGKNKGEVASACAMDVLIEYYQDEPKPIERPQRFFEQAIALMDRKVAGLKDEDGSYVDSGTTIAAVIIDEHQMHIMSVGDSKIYLIRGGMIQTLTREHNYKLILEDSLKNEMISYEEYEEGLAKGEALISYIGMNGIKVMDISREPLALEDRDVVLLCSDGLYKAFSEEQIANIVEACEEQFAETAGVMVQTILNYVPYALDNTSILCFRYREQEKEKDKEE